MSAIELFFVFPNGFKRRVLRIDVLPLHVMPTVYEKMVEARLIIHGNEAVNQMSVLRGDGADDVRLVPVREHRVGRNHETVDEPRPVAAELRIVDFLLHLIFHAGFNGDAELVQRFFDIFLEPFSMVAALWNRMDKLMDNRVVHIELLHIEDCSRKLDGERAVAIVIADADVRMVLIRDAVADFVREREAVRAELVFPIAASIKEVNGRNLFLVYGDSLFPF